MRDFTLLLYKKLLLALSKAEYEFMTFAEFIQSPIAGNLSSVVRPLTSPHLKSVKTVILRHDVDKKPLRSLRTAELENELGINGTYYFRVSKGKLPKGVIERVAKMGHEIGYHYDDLHDAGGDVEKALALFQKNLAALRELTPVKTACMHGSPLSRFDNRDIWKGRNYRDFGIIGEPYFDIDFNEVLYLTDTGRRWDGGLVSIRDKVVSSQESVDSSQESVVSSKKTVINKEKKIHSTLDLINALKNDQLPDKIMLTIHPQRWTDEWLPWVGELVGQKIKNAVKYFIVKRVASR